MFKMQPDVLFCLSMRKKINLKNCNLSCQLHVYSIHIKPFIQNIPVFKTVTPFNEIQIYFCVLNISLPILSFFDSH